MIRRRVSASVAAICRNPDGPREREMLMGAVFVVEDEVGDWVKGHADRDGYPGWVEARCLADDMEPVTHRVCAPRSFAKEAPGLKETSGRIDLSFGVALSVEGADDGWSIVRLPGETRQRFVPTVHLAPVEVRQTDPVEVAEMLLGTPYLWGGNSAFGIDCSGLVQMALQACGVDCPGDSGPQERHFPDATGGYQRGDLLFWKGHVAMVCDADTLIHANAHHMAVAHEPIEAAIARIAAAGDGPVTGHKRPVK